MKVENMEPYYDKIAFSTGLKPCRKRQSESAPPEYETWIAGIHGKKRRTCIDCH